jgi:hypothetical protein
MQITAVPLIVGMLFFAVGTLFAGFAAISWRRRLDLLKNGVSTTGIVIGLDEDDGLYAPIIHFTTYAGESHQHIPSLHSAMSKYRIDDSVSLVYHSDDPNRVEIRSYGTIFYLVFLFLGLLSLCAGLWMIAVGLGLLHTSPCNSSCGSGPTDFSGSLLAAALRFVL